MCPVLTLPVGFSVCNHTLDFAFVTYFVNYLCITCVLLEDSCAFKCLYLMKYFVHIDFYLIPCRTVLDVTSHVFRRVGVLQNGIRAVVIGN